LFKKALRTETKPMMLTNSIPTIMIILLKLSMTRLSENSLNFLRDLK